MQSHLEDMMNSPYSPSFNSLFNADVVARVTSEFPAADEDGFCSNDFQHCNREQCSEAEDDDEFEFNLPDPVPAAGDIRPVYPVFDRDLLLDSDPAQIHLKNLLLGGETPSSSSSSSEADELEQIPAETYCVWAPNKSPGRCTKSSSTGTSKAWKLRDLLLLKRSKSDGRDEGRATMLSTPENKAERRYYGGGEKNKRRSYLPYRQDLLAGGFFVSRHALRKSHLSPFG